VMLRIPKTIILYNIINKLYIIIIANLFAAMVRPTTISFLSNSTISGCNDIVYC
jgi:hypothetical protein